MDSRRIPRSVADATPGTCAPGPVGTADRARSRPEAERAAVATIRGVRPDCGVRHFGEYLGRLAVHLTAWENIFLNLLPGSRDQGGLGQGSMYRVVHSQTELVKRARKQCV